MKYSKLGSSNLDVSRVCLGSMTWGQQNDQQDADEQIQYALSQGINFIDTAELYPIPPKKELVGKTEQIIGNYLNRHPNDRNKMIIASKIAGNGVAHIRGGENITGEAVLRAVDASLKRLNTDFIDLFQLHWPNRPTPHFARHRPNAVTFTNVDKQAHSQQMLEILQALKLCIDEGKIRFCGLSDDTTWGINEYLKLSDKHDLPRLVSIQNEFNLLHNKDWPYLIENCIHEDIAFLPWSPLAGGALTGKYLDGARPAGTRWTMSQRNGLFRDSKQSNEAIKRYVEIARAHAITPAQLALAWCNQVDGVTSTIIGATSLTQLKEDIGAFSIELPQETLDDINDVLKEYPAPF